MVVVITTLIITVTQAMLTTHLPTELVQYLDLLRPKSRQK